MSMYTGPILPPAATSAPGTYLAGVFLYSGVSLYSWIVLVQLNHTNLRHRTATVYYSAGLTHFYFIEDQAGS
jgi:hypothetical protein